MPSHHPRSPSNLSELLFLTPLSRRSSSYLQSFCAMIPHRRKLFLVKKRSLVRRLSASRPSFVAPTGLRHLSRFRPHPRLNLRPRRARYGFPSPVASFWSCLTTTHANFAFQPLSDRAPSGIARLPLTPSASSSPSSPPHLDLRSRRPRPTPVLTLPSSSPSRCHQHPIDHPQLPLRRRHSSSEFPRHL